jgi:hypothetical protein
MLHFRPLSRYLPALALAILVLTAHAEKARKPIPAQPAAQYAFHDAHPNEKVTVAAEPCDSKETIPNTRLNYAQHGYIPMRIIVTNDSDQSITLDDARILFISTQTTAPENAATDEELQRRMFEMKSVAGHKIPLPSPLPDITVHSKPVDKQILLDDDDFGFPTTTVAAHSTIAGYLFYDIRDLDEPVLKGATIELRKARWTSTNKQLDTFEIPLHQTSAPAADNKAAVDKP